MIGLNVTRALTCKFGAPLSAGRVQTPTLGMIMDRENEITGFRSQEYDLLTGDFGNFQAGWRAQGGDGRIFDREKTGSSRRSSRAAADGLLRCRRVRKASRIRWLMI